MQNTLKRITHPEQLARLGKLLRQHREQLGLAQGKARGMRQATVSKIENGRDVNLDTFVAYAGALGLEILLVPIGQGQARFQPGDASSNATPPDILSEFADLRDEAR